MRFISLLLSPALSLCLAPASSMAETLFKKADWQYRYALGDVPENWSKPDFSAADWKTGKSPLGYGEEGLGTTLDFAADPENKPITAPRSGAHAWNEASMPDGSILLVDVMRHGSKPKFIPTANTQTAKRYLRENDQPCHGVASSQPSSPEAKP